MKQTVWEIQLQKWKDEGKLVKVYMKVMANNSSIMYQGKIDKHDEDSMVLVDNTKTCLINRHSVTAIKLA